MRYSRVQFIATHETSRRAASVAFERELCVVARGGGRGGGGARLIMTSLEHLSHLLCRMIAGRAVAQSFLYTTRETQRSNAEWNFIWCADLGSEQKGRNDTPLQSHKRVLIPLPTTRS